MSLSNSPSELHVSLPPGAMPGGDLPRLVVLKPGQRSAYALMACGYERRDHPIVELGLVEPGGHLNGVMRVDWQSLGSQLEVTVITRHRCLNTCQCLWTIGWALGALIPGEVRSIRYRTEPWRLEFDEHPPTTPPAVADVVLIGSPATITARRVGGRILIRDIETLPAAKAG